MPVRAALPHPLATNHRRQAWHNLHTWLSLEDSLQCVSCSRTCSLCWPPSSSRKEGRKEGSLLSASIMSQAHKQLTSMYLSSSLTSRYHDFLMDKVRSGQMKDKLAQHHIAIKGRRQDLNPRPLAVYDTMMVFITVERERVEAMRSVPKSPLPPGTRMAPCPQ